jgi:ribosomal protein S19
VSRRSKTEYSIYVYSDHIEYVKSNDYEVKKVEVRKRPDDMYELTVYVDGRIEVHIEMKYLPYELRWTLDGQKLTEYEKTFGAQTVAQKAIRELIKAIAEYIKL